MKNLDLLRKKLQYSLDARELAKKLNLHCFTELDFMVLTLELEIKKLEQET